MIKLRIFFSFLILALAFPVFALDAVDIYSVIVPVENQSDSQRQAAFVIALQEVTNSLNANSNIKSNADLSELFAHPEHYVESYSYQTDPEQQDALNIIVHFDREALSPFFLQQHVAQSQHVDLQVSGITSALALNAMMHDLSQMNAIKSLTITQVKSESVIVSVMLQGNVANFIQALLTDQHFASLSAEDSQTLEEQTALRFKWIGE